MSEKVNPYVKDYADRIAKGLRHDGYKNQLNSIDARLVGSRYGVDVEGRATTISELSTLIASKLVTTK